MVEVTQAFYSSLWTSCCCAYKLDTLLTYSLHTSLPSVTLPAVLQTVVPSLVEIRCQQMHILTANK